MQKVSRLRNCENPTAMGTTTYDATNFYHPTSFTDPFGNTSTVSYDSLQLFIVEENTSTVAAFDNVTTAIFDSSPRELSGIASGINNTAARAGGLIAVAALGLAFGESDAATIPGTMLISAYRLVLYVAAALAAASALTAALTIRRH